MQKLDMQKLWQHEETGRLVWHEKPGPRWYRIPTIHEDELPNDLTADEYEWWFKNSHVPDGVGCRIGPLLRQPKPGATRARAGRGLTRLFRLLYGERRSGVKAKEIRSFSRQRAYQLRHRAAGLCMKCPRSATTGGFCAPHYQDHLRQKRRSQA